MVKWVGVFLRPNFISQKVKVLPGTHLNTQKYSVCGIKLDTKMISLHKIGVLKISSFPEISMLTITFDYYL